MIGEKYSVSVNDYCVEVYGEITIRQAFDLIHYFDQQGYTHLAIGYENSTLRIIKKKEKEQEEPMNVHEILLKDQERTSEMLREKIKFQEQFIQEIIHDQHGEVLCLKNTVSELEKKIKMQSMLEDPEVKSMIKQLGVCEDVKTKIDQIDALINKMEGAKDERH